jgi:hypothetical protein
VPTYHFHLSRYTNSGTLKWTRAYQDSTSDYVRGVLDDESSIFFIIESNTQLDLYKASPDDGTILTYHKSTNHKSYYKFSRMFTVGNNVIISTADTADNGCV